MTAAPRPSDEQLCETMARRDDSAEAFAQATSAFNEIYSRYARWLLAYLVSRVRKSELEDVAQVVWQRVWERVGVAFHGGKFQVWLFFIARNYLIDLSRRRQPERLGEAEDALPDPRGVEPQSALILREQSERLQSGLARLSATMRQVVSRRLNGESYEAICEALAIPRSKAYKLQQQARTSLADWLSRSSLAPVA